MITIRTNTDKASIAAQFLFSSWSEDAGKCVYRDDSNAEDYVCESEEEMVELYDLITSDDEDTRRDAYSIWCSQTSHFQLI
jgi:hypothetical protein